MSADRQRLMHQASRQRRVGTFALALAVGGVTLPSLAVADTPTEPGVVVPLKTAVELELLENLNSKLTKTGDAVRFRVADDVVVDGRVVFAKGTAVLARVKFAEPSRSNGRAGTLRVVASGVPAVDGGEVPVFGELVAAGRQRSDTAAFSTIAGGVGFLALRGRQAFYFRGEIFEVLVRSDQSVRTGIATERLEHASTIPAAAPTARVDESVSVFYNPAKGNVPEELSLTFPLEPPEREPRLVEIVQVDELRLAEPVPADRLKRKADGWEASFEGWSVIRHLFVGEGGGSNRIRLVATCSDRSQVEIELPVTLELR